MRLISFVLMTVFLVSCSSTKKEKEIIKEKVAASTVSTPQSLGQTIETHIESSTTLTDAQKTELRTILNENKRLAEELSAESYRNRGVLVQELLSGTATPKRVKILEREIERIEKLRLKNTFDTVKKISKIVSNQPDRSQFAEEMMQFENRGSAKR